MSDRPDPFNRLNEAAEQDIEDYEMNEGVVDELVAEADRIFEYQSTDSYAGHRDLSSRVTGLTNAVKVPSEEVDSLDLSAALIRIADSQYQGDDRTISEIKGALSSALLKKLDEAYPKHWEIRLGGKEFSFLFSCLSRVNSLHIADCTGVPIGWKMSNVEYVCFENIDGIANKMKPKRAVFKDCASMGKTFAIDSMNASTNLIAYETQSLPVLGLDIDQSYTVYVQRTPSDHRPSLTRRSFKSFADIEAILYDDSTGVDVPEEMAKVVRPLTNNEYKIIERLAVGSPPDEEELSEAMAELTSGVDRDE